MHGRIIIQHGLCIEGLWSIMCSSMCSIMYSIMGLRMGLIDAVVAAAADSSWRGLRGAGRGWRLDNKWCLTPPPFATAASIEAIPNRTHQAAALTQHEDK